MELDIYTMVVSSDTPKGNKMHELTIVAYIGTCLEDAMDRYEYDSLVKGNYVNRKATKILAMEMMLAEEVT